MAIKLELEAAEVQAIIDHLNEGKHGVVRPLIDKIIEQTNPQMQPATPIGKGAKK